MAGIIGMCAVEHQSLDIFWILFAALLVFFMQAGFMCLEVGLTRAKNSINVAAKNAADFVVSVLIFWGLGFGLMFGATAGGWLGGSKFFLAGVDSPFSISIFLFQTMFCAAAATIVSGAVAERMRFRSYILITILVSAVVYPLFGHWAWNGLDIGEKTGWLGAMGFVDFAGSTVVHSIGGWVALAAIVVIGARRGRFAEDGSPQLIPGTNLPFAMIGALFLWFGWFGFNGGSTLAFNNLVPGVLTNTLLAGVSGAFVSLAISWWLHGAPRVPTLINGSLAGLVAITASSLFVTPAAAVLIGGGGGVVMLLTSALLERFRIDDAIGAVPVHLGAGVWGTLAVALFGDEKLIGSGLSFAGQLVAQLQGIVAAFLLGFCFVYVVLKGIDRIWPLRVSEENETVGLNISEHGAVNDYLEFLNVIEEQAKTMNLDLRAPEEPFTEVGRIARQYNKLIDALKAARTTTDAIVGASSDAIITFAANSLLIRSVNPAVAGVFGYSPDDLIGKSVTSLLANDGMGSFWRTGEDVDQDEMKSYLGRRIELDGRDTSGQSFPMEVSVSESEDGSGAYYIGTFRNISEQQTRERELREAQATSAEAEKRHRAILETSPIAVAVVRMAGEIVFTNGRMEELLGYDEGGLVGINARGFFARPEERDEVVETIRTEARVSDREIELVRSDGTTVWVLLSSQLFDFDGEPTLTTWFYDITERRRVSEELKTTLEAIPVPVVLSNRKSNNLIYVNAQATKIYGIEVGGQVTAAYRNPDDRKRLIELLERDGAVDGFEALIANPDGEDHWVLMSARLMEFEGEPTVLVASNIITERKRAEEEVARSREVLQSTLDGLDESISLFDAEDHIIMMNQKCIDINPSSLEVMNRGGKFEDVLRANIEEGIVPEAAGREEEFIRARVAAHQNPTGEATIRNYRDGRKYLIRESKTPEDGILMTFVEITNLAQAQEEAAQARDMLQSTLDGVDEAISVFDADDNIIMQNKKCIEINPTAADWREKGGKFEDVLRSNIEQGIVPVPDGDDVEEFVRARVKAHQNPTGEAFIRNYGNGRKYLIRESRTPEGGILMSFVDITELAQAQEEAAQTRDLFADAIESIPDGFISFDAEDRLVTSNSRYKEMFPNLAESLKPGVHYKDLVDQNTHVDGLIASEEEEEVRRVMLEAHKNPTGEPILRHIESGA